MNISSMGNISDCNPGTKRVLSECEANWSRLITYQVYYKYIAWFQYISILILNFTVAFTILQSHNLKRSRSNRFFLVLITTHFFNGVYGVAETVWVATTKSIAIFELSGDVTLRVYLWIVNSLNMIAVLASTILVVIDRYIAVRFTFFYEQMSRLQVLGFTFLGILTPGVIFITTWKVWNIDGAVRIVFAVMGFIPVLMIYLQFSIYVQTKKQINAIIRTTVSQNMQEQYSQRKRLLKKKLRSLVISMLLMFSCILFYLPLGILLVLHFRRKYIIQPTYYILAQAIVGINSITDPLVYSYLTRSIREILLCKVNKATKN